MTTVTEQELQRDLPRLLDLAAAGERVRVQRESGRDLLLVALDPGDEGEEDAGGEGDADTVDLYDADDEGVRDLSRRIARENHDTYTKLSDLP